jgi:hypothetical protein
MDVEINRLCISIHSVYISIHFRGMGHLLRRSCCPLYDVPQWRVGKLVQYTLQYLWSPSQVFLTNIEAVPPPTPLLYYDSAQKSPLFLKGIVSRDFVVCFLVSFDRSYISTHKEQVILLLKVRFRTEFFDFRVWPW